MYRSAMLWLPCQRCGAEHPARAMSLSPRGQGHVCWSCELRDQIRDHHRREREREHYAWLGALAGLAGFYWVLCGVL